MKEASCVEWREREGERESEERMKATKRARQSTYFTLGRDVVHKISFHPERTGQRALNL